MNNASGGFLSILKDFIDRLFGRKKPVATPRPITPKPSHPADSNNEPAQLVTSKVLLLVYDPVMDSASGLKLSQSMSWNPVDTLVTAFMADILQSSQGVGRYQITQQLEANEFLPLADGFSYTAQTYMDVMRGITPPHKPMEIDYQNVLEKYNILQRVSNKEIDEVWIFGFPYAGLYESTMGGMGAFWCNAPILWNTQSCRRRFVVMGFNFERGVGEMLESFGHRAEAIISRAYENISGDANLWLRFTRYEKVAPGKAEVGSIHFAPNSERDYDWGNTRQVNSFCDNWYKFPDLSGPGRVVNAIEWGNGDTRLHHIWWLKHLPQAAGRKNGIHNNWWQYIMDPNNIGM